MPAWSYLHPVWDQASLLQPQLEQAGMLLQQLNHAGMVSALLSTAYVQAELPTGDPRGRASPCASSPSADPWLFRTGGFRMH